MSTWRGRVALWGGVGSGSWDGGSPLGRGEVLWGTQLCHGVGAPPRHGP